MTQFANLFSGRQFIDSNGNPYVGAKLFSYTAGTSTKATLTRDEAGSSNHTNPIILNARGEPADAGGSSQAMWQTAGVSIKLVLAPSTDTDPPLSAISTWDNLDGINDGSLISDQWIAGPAPTYISATTFSLVGDKTNDFHVGRRLKTTNTAGTIYSTIASVVFTTLTTVTVVNDSGVLDSGLSDVRYGIISKTNTSAPELLLKGRSQYGTTWTHGTDVTNDFDISAGGCMDAANAYWMSTTTIIGKQADVAWAVGGTAGTPLGMLDTGAVANSDYYIWMIARSDTGVVDFLSSLSSTAPTMPTGYDFKRLRGWFKRLAGVNTLMDVYETEGGGVEVAWRAPIADINLTNTLTTTRRTDAVKVPLNFSVMANLTVRMTDAASGFSARVMCPTETDVSVSTIANCGTAVLGNTDSETMMVRTSAAGLIAARADLAIVDTYIVITNGFTWARRN